MLEVAVKNASENLLAETGKDAAQGHVPLNGCSTRLH